MVIRAAARSAIILTTIAGSLLLSSCGGIKDSLQKSVFYNQVNPQALQRDTIDASGTRRSFIDYEEFKANGIVKLAAVESIAGRDSATIAVPAGAAEFASAFEQPRKLMVPSGFTVDLYAWGLGRARDVVMGENGTIYVSSMDEGKVFAIPANGTPVAVAEGLDDPHGMDFADGSLYITDETHVYRFTPNTPDGTAGTTTLMTDGIPKGGDFFTRAVRYKSSDKSLYVSVGVPDANGEESDRGYGTIYRISKEGAKPSRLLITGLRNTIGMDVHPVTGDLWGIDEGMDNLAEQLAPEEINILTSGGQFGHPYFYSQNFRNSQYLDANPILVPKDPRKPVIELQPYSAPTDLEFYDSDAMGADWKNSMLIVMNGYVFRGVDRPKELRTGFKVMRVRSAKDGSDARTADVFSGWLQSNGDYWGQPVGITWSNDGKTFFVTDERNGVVYRFTRS